MKEYNTNLNERKTIEDVYKKLKNDYSQEETM